MEKKKTKYNLACGPLPIHPQHYQVMTNPEEWELVDLYIKDPIIKNWDMTKLDEISDNSAEHFYISHGLEHLSYRQIPQILVQWYSKLKPNGILTLNVPDLTWAARQVIRYENAQPLQSEVYQSFEGHQGLQAIIYGTHEHDGEYHKAGFTKRSLHALLQAAQFIEINIDSIYDAHDMQVLFATAKK